MQKPIETFDPRRFYMQKPQRLLTPAMRDFKPPKEIYSTRDGQNFVLTVFQKWLRVTVLACPV